MRWFMPHDDSLASFRSLQRLRFQNQCYKVYDRNGGGRPVWCGFVWISQNSTVKFSWKFHTRWFMPHGDSLASFRSFQRLRFENQCYKVYGRNGGGRSDMSVMRFCCPKGLLCGRDIKNHVRASVCVCAPGLDAENGVIKCKSWISGSKSTILNQFLVNFSESEILVVRE